MEFLTSYGLFLAKTLTFLVAVGVVIILVSSFSGRGRKSDKGSIEVTHLNEKYDDLKASLRDAMLDDDEYKAFVKAEKAREKVEQAEKKKALKSKVDDEQADDAPAKKRVFVLDFYGDMKASEVDCLREEITTLLTIATPADEVVVKVESGGGMVHAYGLASSQLARITNKNIPLTVCVDKVAASGGYMMACVADKIVAAPFAILGSIGVVAQLPNFHKLLKKNSVDYEMFTAGEYKRTVTMFGENTDKGRAKFVEELEETHVLFKNFVSENRPQVDIDAVATGEVWYGAQAKAVALIDEIQTSDEYLFAQADKADIFEIEFTFKKSLPEKFGLAAQGAVDRLLLSWWDRLTTKYWM